MKRILLLALGVFLALPAVVGIVDAWCYTLLGAQATGLDWTGGRSVTAYIFGAISIAPIAFSLLMDEPPRILGYQPLGPNSNPPPTYERPPPPPSPPPPRDVRGRRG